MLTCDQVPLIKVIHVIMCEALYPVSHKDVQYSDSNSDKVFHLDRDFVGLRSYSKSVVFLFNAIFLQQSVVNSSLSKRVNHCHHFRCRVTIRT